MKDTTSFPTLTPQDLEEIEKQAINIERKVPPGIFDHPLGIDPKVPRLMNGYSGGYRVLYCTLPDGGTLEVNPVVFEQVLDELLAAKGMQKVFLHDLMEEARKRWEAQCLEAAKLEMAIEFWKRFSVRGVFFFPKKSPAGDE